MPTTRRTEHQRALDETALYLGDNGRIFCGKRPCAGSSALHTGRDLSGQRVERLGPDDILAWIAETGDVPACEDCGRVATLVVPARAPLSTDDKVRIECAMAVESWAIGNPEAAREDDVLRWLATQDETTLSAIHCGHVLGHESWERALGRKDARA